MVRRKLQTALVWGCFACLASGCAKFDRWAPASLDFASGFQIPASKQPDQAATIPHRPDRKLFAKGRLCERQGDLPQAADIYRTVAEIYPADPRPHHRLGVIAARLEKFDQANEHFSRARELAPPTVDLLSDQGYAYYLQKNYEKSAQTLREVLAEHPHHEVACNNLALVLGAQERYDEALAMFRRVNSEAVALANLARVYTERGLLEQAQATLAKSMMVRKQQTSETFVQKSSAPQPMPGGQAAQALATRVAASDETSQARLRPVDSAPRSDSGIQLASATEEIADDLTPPRELRPNRLRDSSGSYTLRPINQQRPTPRVVQAVAEMPVPEPTQPIDRMVRTADFSKPVEPPLLKAPAVKFSAPLQPVSLERCETCEDGCRALPPVE